MKYVIATLVALSMYSCSKTEQSADAYGNFEAEEMLLSAESNGKLLSINIDEGQLVKQGDILAVVDTTNTILQINQLQARKKAVLGQKNQLLAQINITNQQIKNLERDNQRFTEMKKDGAATQKQLDDIEGQLMVLKKQIDASHVQMNTIDAQAQEIDATYALLLKQKNDCIIKSPISGTVLQKYAERGELVNMGKTIAKLADLSNLELRVFVSGTQLSQVKLGSEVTVLSDSPEGIFKDKGTVSWISSKAEFTPKTIQTRNERVDMVYAVKVKVKNDGRYKIGMPGEIAFK